MENNIATATGRATGEIELTRLGRQVLLKSRHEAKQLNSRHIDSEHILLSMIKGERGIAANVLVNLDMNFCEIEKEVYKLVIQKTEEAKKQNGGSQARQILTRAIEESKNLNHNYVGTEDLLLAMLHFKEGIAAKALANLHLCFEKVKPETQRILNLLKR